MTTLDLLKRSKPDWQLFRQRSASEPGMAPLVAHIGSVPIPLGPFLSVTGRNAQRYNPEAERALHETRQGYYLDAQKQTARRIAKTAAGR